VEDLERAKSKYE
jgi:hypothetical protein